MKREGRIVYVVGLTRLRMRLAALDPGRRDDVGSTPPISDPCNSSRLRMTRNKWGCVHTLFLGFGKMMHSLIHTYWLMMDGTVDPAAWRKMGREGMGGLARGVWCVEAGGTKFIDFFPRQLPFTTKIYFRVPIGTVALSSNLSSPSPLYTPVGSRRRSIKVL